MAVAKMKIVSIVGLLHELDSVIKMCGKSQVFQPDDASHFYSEMKGFTQLNEKNSYSMSLQLLKDTLESAGLEPENVDVSNFHVGKKEIDDYVTRFSSKLGKILAEKGIIDDKIKELNRKIDQISHFTGQNLNLQEIFACKFIKVRFGRIPKESFVKLQSYQDNPYVLFFPCTGDSTHYWGVYFAPREQAADIDRIFGGLYFERIWIDSFEGTPEEHVASLRAELKLEQVKFNDVNKKLESFWGANKEQCMRFYTKINELDTYFSMKKYVYKYKKSFILIGWIPEEAEDKFKTDLEILHSVEYSIEPAETELKHSPPVKLKNFKLFKPFEFFIDMYGLPSYNEMDPTAFVAITYTILYGIMFADLGQGIVLSFIGYFMWKLKGMMLGKALIPCGISGAIFGTIFGSVFGFEEALNPMYKSLFGLHEKPIEVSNSTNELIIAALGIGIVCVIVAMIMCIYSSIKKKDYGKCLFDPSGVTGLVFYISLLVGVGGKMLNLFDVLSVPYILGLIVFPVVLMFLREPLIKIVNKEENWKPSSWGEFILQNVFELIEIMLSYFTNTVSFLRVGAFIIAHAGMMQAVFTIAGMFSGLGYVITVVVGNAIVIALEALLTGIQVMRLEFYEMFSRFFDGQGRPFVPICAPKTALKSK